MNPIPIRSQRQRGPLLCCVLCYSRQLWLTRDLVWRKGSSVPAAEMNGIGPAAIGEHPHEN